MSAIYGAEHFLRMLGECMSTHESGEADVRLGSTVNLPQMVASSSMDGVSVGILKEYVNELLQ